ncbi:conserved hypothetical protein [Ricinus communis]|uniref:Uncharacterized protein n=1 Tax=Ricinus communis TaxID=3988 RepID=B9RWV3_RICCO|nr:conserved hypothetical protein [Ricinus communis]
MNVEGAVKVMTTSIDKLTESNLQSIGYIRIKGIWRNLDRDPLREGEEEEERSEEE